MAVKDGVTYNKITIKQSQKHFPDTYQTIYREVYWARYVDWSLTTPLLLLDLAFLAGLSGANILVAVVSDVIMILTGLFAALTVEESHKWGYYAIACISYLVVVYQLAVNARAVAASKDSKTATFFGAIGGFTLILWTVYPMYVDLAVTQGAKDRMLTCNVAVSGGLLMVPVTSTLMLRSSPTPSLMYSPSLSLASGCCSPMTLKPGRLNRT